MVSYFELVKLSVNLENIMDKVDKKVGWKLDSGEVNPIDSVRSWNYFGNYGHKIGGMGYIDSDKINPAH